MPDRNRGQGGERKHNRKGNAGRANDEAGHSREPDAGQEDIDEASPMDRRSPANEMPGQQQVGPDKKEAESDAQTKAPAEDMEEESPPSSPGNWGESPINTPNPQAPIFIVADPDVDRYMPYQDEDSPVAGRSMADAMAQDQIRRAGLVLGRPLSESEKQTILDYYADMRQRRAPHETSENTIIDAPTAEGDRAGGSNAASGGLSSRDSHDLGSPLLSRVAALEQQRALDKKLLDSVTADMAELVRDNKAIKKKLMSLEKQIVSNSTKPEAAQPQRTEIPHRGLARLRHFGLSREQWAGSLAVVVCTLTLEWLVAEAVLHSKWLSDGYGTYINGGYNGLGGVLIFGSWTKFLVFQAVLVYTGYWSIQGVLGR